MTSLMRLPNLLAEQPGLKAYLNKADQTPREAKSIRTCEYYVIRRRVRLSCFAHFLFMQSERC
jgi:hypothetical protein